MLLCHAQVPWAEGGFVGLDIFYVLSGFLITGLILGEWNRTGSFSIRNFYARRAKRLLPLASTVLIFVLFVSLITFEVVRQIEVAGDVIASALYYVNWHFIAQGVDYFAVEEGLVSPVQHYWSLSVEEQFYLVWPLLIMLSTLIGSRLRANRNLMVFWAIAPVAVASLIYSITFTDAQPEAAYFSSLTRIWELAFGAILAVTLPRATRLRTISSEILVIGGIAAILVAGYLFQETDPYPGWRALIPVLGTCAVIVGGSAAARGLGVRFLSLPPFQYLGKISYAWYLWHWPFIVFAMSLWGSLTPRQLVLVTLASWIPAEVSHRLIEEPFRRSKKLNLQPARAFGIAATFSLAVIGIAFVLKTDRIDLTEAPESQVAGARAMKGKLAFQKTIDKVRPFPSRAREDKGEAFDKGCLVIGPVKDSPSCRFDEGPEDAPRIVLFGDSHALQYSPALLKIAKKKKMNLTVLTRGNCLLADIDYKHYCDIWRRNSLKRIERDEKPAITVVATSTLDVYSLKRDGKQLSRNESEPLLIDAMKNTLNRLKSASGRVVLIRDQARSPFLAFECVAENPKNLKRCMFRPKRRANWAFDYEGAKRASVPIVDPQPMLCRNDECPSVIGDVLVYRDTYHLSATYSRSLSDWLERELENAG